MSQDNTNQLSPRERERHLLERASHLEREAKYFTEDEAAEEAYVLAAEVRTDADMWGEEGDDLPGANSDS